jgi:hypothetical protein
MVSRVQENHRSSQAQREFLAKTGPRHTLLLSTPKRLNDFFFCIQNEEIRLEFHRPV